jgi:predicted permease
MNDLRLALRFLRNQLGFATAAVLTLGLGIGMVSTQYSLIDGVLLRPLPYPEGQRIVHVARSIDAFPGAWNPLGVNEYVDLAAEQQSFEAFAAFRSETYNVVTGAGMPQRYWGTAVTTGFFDVIKVRPSIGRTFLAGEDVQGQPLRALISHALWRDRFGSDPAVLGRTVRLNGENAEIIGVMPEAFSFPGTDQVWVNHRLPPAGVMEPGDLGLQGLGLLKPGASASSAAAELELAARRHRERQGKPLDDLGSIVAQPVPRAYNGGGTSTLFGTLFAMTVFVLLLACFNVANLLYVRATDRLRDLAVRSALGAGRRRIVRQLLAESLVLGVLGALAGVLLAAGGVTLLQAQADARIELPGWISFDLSPRVIAATIATAVLAGLLAGVMPAVRAARVDIATVLRSEGRGSVGTGDGRLRRWMVAGQLAFACMALLIAALLAVNAARSSAVTLAYDPQSLLIGRIELQGLPYAEVSARTRFYQQLTERVAAAPGVAAAAVSSRDLVASGVYENLEIGGASYAREQDKPGALLEVVSRDYFRVVDRQALAGRLFGPQDHERSDPVALVNRSFAERFFAGRDPIGQRLRRATPDAQWATIIGIVPDLTMEGLGSNLPAAGWYLLQDQIGWGWLDLLVRVEGDATALVPTVRAAVAAIDPDQPVHTIVTLDGRAARAMAGLDIISGMSVVFAFAALLLAAIGVFGVVAYGARQRTREFAMRLALGSSSAGIVWMMLRQNALFALGGTLAGVLAGYALTQPLANALPRAPTDEPLVYLVIAALLLTTAAIACWLPARRAAGVDPIEALRAD